MRRLHSGYHQEFVTVTRQTLVGRLVSFLGRHKKYAAVHWLGRRFALTKTRSYRRA